MPAVAVDDSQPEFDKFEEPTVTLESALEALKSARAQGQNGKTELALCQSIESVDARDFGTLLAAANYFLEQGNIASAEHFAIKVLQVQPARGAGYRLFGDILKAKGDASNAVLCLRYHLPQYIVDQYFHVTATRKVLSKEAHDSGVNRITVFPAEQIELARPIRIESAVVRKLEDAFFDASEAFTVTVPQGRLWFDGFVVAVWDQEDRLLTDVCRGNPELVDPQSKIRAPVHLNGRVALLGNRNAKNYYHWMNDVLPALELIRKAGIALDSIDTFVVNPLTSQFQRETLAHFGIEESRLHSIKDGEFMAADELVLPRYGSNSLGTSQGRWNPEFLRREFAPEKPLPQIRKLYLSRGTQGSRSVSNEEDLQDVLDANGFETVHLEGMNIYEQAELFSQANMILGPHGAGFSNIAFCLPGTRVIEMFSTHMQPCFWSIASALNFTYAALYCDESEYADSKPLETSLLEKPQAHREAGFRVNPQEVADLLVKVEEAE